MKNSGGFRPFKNLKKLVKKEKLYLPKMNENAPIQKTLPANAQKCTPNNKADPINHLDPKSAAKKKAKSYKNAGGFKPFEDLKRHFNQSTDSKKKLKNRKNSLSDRYAWQDHKTRRIHSDNPTVKSVCSHLSDQDALERLVELVETGKGFVLSDTAEYMEGLNSITHPALLSKIHNGQFSIQDYIDLHGRGVEDANHLFHQFIKRSISTGKNSVLIVHGRGLSSPNGPVLKEKIKYWLTKGPLRKWIVAFASARAVDGGTGATCVLLRHTPLTKRYRKKIAALT